MSNILKAPVETVDNVHSQVANFHREIKSVRPSQMKNTSTEVKNIFESLADLTQPRKEAVNLKVGQ